MTTARDLIKAVQKRDRKPIELVEEAIARADAAAELGTMQELFDADARDAAKSLAERTDLDKLPLAGLPVLIKDNIPVAGHPMRVGSLATSDEASATDHEVVRRLREAGAIVVGTTRVPELCVWGSTDSAFGMTRNPWNPERSTGGSSGGSAAAVAAGIVPVAHAADGMGSIRIPAAANGVFGIKPGRDVVPADMGRDSWGGMSENGPVAAHVADAALVLSVMADDKTLADVQEPQQPLRIAVAANTPSFLVSLSSNWRRALDATAEILRAQGHTVTAVRYPYPSSPIPLFARWFAGVATDAEGLDESKLEPRTRRHVKIGRRAQRRGWVKAADADRATAVAREFFADYDVLLTPMLARAVPPARDWRTKSWLANIWSNMQYAPFAAHWNMLGWPAASIPAGLDANGMPLAVQAAAPAGGEALILSLALQLERVQPWPLRE